MGNGKTWMKKLGELLFYGGLKKTQYRAIADDMDEANRKSLVVLSAACVVVYAVRLCISYTVVPFVNRVVFGIAIAVFSLIVYLNRFGKRRRLIVHCSAYLFMAIYLGVGIFTAIGPGSIQERTTLYLVFVAAAPMLFALNAVEMAAVIVPAEILYLVLITRYQVEYPVYQTNVSNSLFFSISGLMLGIYMSDMKVMGIYNAYENLRMEEIRRLNEELQKSRSDLRLALEAEEHANRAKTTFLNNMSHDIRTPMNAIIGFTSLAASHIDNKEQVQIYLEKIMTSSRHLLSLINDVLDMSRIESGKVKIEEKPVHLSDVLHDLSTIIQTEASKKQLDLRISTEDVVNEDVIADQLRVSQVLLNILGNAVKFTHPGGRVALCVIQKPGAPDGYADFEFHVKDNGIGMSREFQAHIFEAFTRENRAVVNGIQGTGLGMTITKNMVDLMGGTITVASEEEKGTEFVVALRFAVSGKDAAALRSEPCGRMKMSLQARTETDPASRMEFSGKKILLAEDNDLNQEIAVAILQENGFVVDVAGNGAEALEKIKAAEPGYYDLILMDVQMPKMNGYDATREIRALNDPDRANIPIIAMTANAFAEDKQAAAEAGMNGHIAKPIEIPVLLETLKKILA